MQKSFGISFKGGLARGFGSIGIVRFFQEEGLQPNVVAGCSAGALIAAMYALGFDWQTMLEIVHKIRLFRILSLRSLLVSGSFVSYRYLHKNFLKYCGDKKIEDLPMKLIIYATDLHKKERYYLEKGSLIDALIASCGFPLVFPTIKISGHTLIDGAFSAGYSTSKLKAAGAEVVIGIGNKSSSREKSFKIKILDTILQSYTVLIDQLETLHDKLDPVDLEIIYKVSGQNIYDFQKLELVTKRAYKEAQKNRQQVLDLIGY
jgi:NTE family protein